MNLFSVKTEKSLVTFILPLLAMYVTTEIGKASVNELKSKLLLILLLIIIVCRENIIGLKHSEQR